MYETAQITSIKKDRIIVKPLLTEHCLGCANHCELEEGKPFSVSNPKNLTLKVGQFVNIDAARKTQGRQALKALLIPSLFGILGWFFTDILSILLKKTPTEASHVLGVLLGFSASAIVIAIISHKKNSTGSYITRIVETSNDEIRKKACLLH